MCSNNMEPVKKTSDQTDTTKESSQPVEDQQQPSPAPQYDDVILGQLARQLEYYFSQANLEKDTYVETLRQLNDGYVPVSILTRFSKVQAFAPAETSNAITKAATDCSEQLEVVSVDTKTGKRVKDASGSTILAVGPISGKPLQQLSGPHPAVVPTSSKSDVQNTIIIREVDSTVTEADVRALFSDEHCPPIQGLYLDFANCWFVTMDTDSRDDMLYVMMQLRTQYLGDEPVKARLKSLVRTVDPAMPVVPVLTSASSYNQLPNVGASSESSSSANINKGNNSNKKKQNKKRTSKNSGTSSSANNNSNNRGSMNNGSNSMNNQGQNQGKNNRSGNQRNNSNANSADSSNSKKAEKQKQPEPDFSAQSFPALSEHSTSRKVEVVVDGMDAAEKKPVISDTSSTATTMSSSSSSVTKQQQQQAQTSKAPLGGYAAALLKAKPPAAPEATAKKNDASNSGKSTANGKKGEASSESWSKKNGKQRDSQTFSGKKENAARAESATVVVKPPTWGGGRSFADVLRKEEASA